VTFVLTNILGTLNLYVEDVCYVTCQKTKLKAILQYLGDSWLGKAKHRVEGVIYEYVEGDDIERIKDVPSKSIRARIEGSWMSQLYYTLPGSSVSFLYPASVLVICTISSIFGLAESEEQMIAVPEERHLFFFFFFCFF
jgi:hypothetical protein